LKVVDQDSQEQVEQDLVTDDVPGDPKQASRRPHCCHGVPNVASPALPCQGFKQLQDRLSSYNTTTNNNTHNNDDSNNDNNNKMMIIIIVTTMMMLMMLMMMMMMKKTISSS